MLGFKWLALISGVLVSTYLALSFCSVYIDLKFPQWDPNGKWWSLSFFQDPGYLIGERVYALCEGIAGSVSEACLIAIHCAISLMAGLGTAWVLLLIGSRWSRRKDLGSEI